MNSRSRAACALILLALTAPGLSGCSTLGKLAFWRKPAPVPEVAQEIVAEPAPGATAVVFPQTWQRNAVRVDVTALAGQGSLKLHPQAGHDWPIRLEFLARPGAFAHLQVVGDQRVVLAVPADGDSVVLKVPAGVYSSATKELVLTWSTGA